MENTCFMNEVIGPRNKNNRTTNYSTVRSTYIRVKLSLKLETLLLSPCHGLSISGFSNLPWKNPLPQRVED